MSSIHITSFVRRQTPQSGFSHWTISDDELISRVVAGLPNAKRGYRDGVLLVPVKPDGFFAGLVKLKDGDKLVGEYKARRPGEDPRKSTYALDGVKMPAVSVYVVLYAHDVLAEKNENETDAAFEVVSVNANVTEEEAPIPTGALIANHFGLSGGTNTNMTDSEFVALLRKSVEFWKDKALACPQELKPDAVAVDIFNCMFRGWAAGDFRLASGISYGQVIEWTKSQGGDPTPLLRRMAELEELAKNYKDS
jgi:hypothetical protein